MSMIGLFSFGEQPFSLSYSSSTLIIFVNSYNIFLNLTLFDSAKKKYYIMYRASAGIAYESSI